MLRDQRRAKNDRLHQVLDFGRVDYIPKCFYLSPFQHYYECGEVKVTSINFREDLQKPSVLQTLNKIQADTKR